jgi:hypothetical protein
VVKWPPGFAVERGMWSEPGLFDRTVGTAGNSSSIPAWSKTSGGERPETVRGHADCAVVEVRTS